MIALAICAASAAALALFLAAARVGTYADTPPPTSIDQARASGLFPALNTEETRQ